MQPLMCYRHCSHDATVLLPCIPLVLLSCHAACYWRQISCFRSWHAGMMIVIGQCYQSIARSLALRPVRFRYVRNDCIQGRGIQLNIGEHHYPRKKGHISWNIPYRGGAHGPSPFSTRSATMSYHCSRVLPCRKPTMTTVMLSQPRPPVSLVAAMQLSIRFSAILSSGCLAAIPRRTNRITFSELWTSQIPRTD